MSNEFVPDPRREAAAELQAETLLRNLYRIVLAGGIVFMGVSTYILFQ